MICFHACDKNNEQGRVNSLTTSEQLMSEGKKGLHTIRSIMPDDMSVSISDMNRTILPSRVQAAPG